MKPKTSNLSSNIVFGEPGTELKFAIPPYVDGRVLLDVCIKNGQTSKGTSKWIHLYVTDETGVFKLYQTSHFGLYCVGDVRLRPDDEDKAIPVVKLKYCGNISAVTEFSEADTLEKWLKETLDALPDTCQICYCAIEKDCQEYWKRTLRRLLRVVTPYRHHPEFANFRVDFPPPANAVQAEAQMPVRIRLSKEDWLRQHYPELSELPKWRFPAVAG
jgi:hypothetical protein